MRAKTLHLSFSCERVEARWRCTREGDGCRCESGVGGGDVASVAAIIDGRWVGRLHGGSLLPSMAPHNGKAPLNCTHSEWQTLP
jgi:hypothetical protein